METILFLLLGFALIFLLLTTLIIGHNSKYFKGLTSDNLKRQEPSPLVSVLIPARNEEENLPRLLKSLDDQDYPDMEILILDDGSDDRTRSIAEDFSKRSDRSVFVHSGLNKPDDWLGKNWACNQLADFARGSVLIFLDADTWLDRSCINQIVMKMQHYQLDFATVWPHQIMPALSEKTVISTVYATIVTYLPTYYSYRAPRWIPLESLRERLKPLFASACGQCMVFTKQAYSAIEGHASVKNEVIEDVMLSKMIVRSGMTMRMFHGTDKLWCRMYRSHHDLFQGFRKNFFAGFGYRLLPFISAWILHILVFLLPPILLLLLLTDNLAITLHYEFLAGITVITVIPFLQRLWVCYFLKWPSLTAFLYLTGVLWFQILAFTIIYDHMFRSVVTWKGRKL